LATTVIDWRIVAYYRRRRYSSTTPQKDVAATRGPRFRALAVDMATSSAACDEMVEVLVVVALGGFLQQEATTFQSIQLHQPPPTSQPHLTALIFNLLFTSSLSSSTQ
jgi:hypothetical protein